MRCLPIAVCLIATSVIFPRIADAGYIAIGEAGDTFATATNVDGAFDLSADADIFNATTILHASITSANNATTDVDWYSFTGQLGDSLDLDIDYAWHLDPNQPSFDSTLALFDSSGTLLAYTDDMFVGPLDAGTESQLDSFIGTYLLPYSGLYYVAVSNFANFPTGRVTTGTLTAPNGAFGGYTASGESTTFSGEGFYNQGTYTLHISTGTAEVPEPSSIALLGAGLVGLCGCRARRRRG